MTTEDTPNKDEGVTLSRTRIWAFIALSLLPTLVILAGVKFAGGASEMGIRWADPTIAEQLSGPFVYTLVQVCGFCIAVFAALLCIAHFSHTGDVSAPVLGLGLVCVAAVDIWQTLAADALIPIHTAVDVFIPLTWTMSRALYAGVVLLSALVFLVSGRMRSERKRRQTLHFSTGMSVVLVVVATVIIFRCGLSPEFAESLYGTGKQQLFWNLLPLGLFLLAGVYVLPTYFMWHRSVFGQSLILSMLPLALGQMHFAVGLHGSFDGHFLAANVLKLLGYLIPLAGLMLDYQHTYGSLDKSNKDLGEKLFLFEQSQGVTRQRQKVLDHLMQSLPEPVCLLDTSLRTTMLNEAAAQLAGLASPFLGFGKRLDQLLGDGAGENQEQVCREVIKTGVSAKARGPILGRREGEDTVLTVEWVYIPVTDEGGRTLSVLCIGQRVGAGSAGQRHRGEAA